MNNIMEYRGYNAKIEFSTDDNCFYGTIIGINDSISFEGESVSRLRSAFEEAVDDYLLMCEEIGKEPHKAYKGSFNVRIKPELHKQASILAISKGVSLNQVVEEAIEHELSVAR